MCRFPCCTLRFFLSAIFLALGFGIQASAQTTTLTNPITPGSITINLQSFVTINTGSDGTPQDLVSANDGSGRLFIATRNGKIRVVDSSGNLQPTPFLDMSGSAGLSIYTGGEGGLLGLAFSPNFSAASNVPGSGKFYTFTTEPFSTTGPAADFSHPELFPSTGVNPNNQIVIREWSVSSLLASVSDTTSRVLMRINHPQSNHQGGGLKFGPDGNLYISLGDGGGGNDFNGSATSTTDGHTNSIGNGQDTSVVFGKILRIDTTGTNSANHQYGIPATNPFVGASGSAVKEIYAYGLRNPYRFSFDNVSRGGTGALYAGDVGQNQREEVDIITSGSNYGWVFREGTLDNTSASGRTQPTGFTSTAPIAEYTHGDGTAILGGFVYRGTLLPQLQGKYVFGDLAKSGTGRLFYMDAAAGPISEFRYATANGSFTPSTSLLGFGENATNGELYALFANGQVLAIVPEPGAAGLLSLGFGALVFWRRKCARQARQKRPNRQPR